MATSFGTEDRGDAIADHFGYGTSGNHRLTARVIPAQDERDIWQDCLVLVDLLCGRWKGKSQHLGDIERR